MFRLFRLDPPNGWRHVWWELAIVTIGVLIALIAQQVAEEASWRQRAAVGRERLTDELKMHYAQLYEQASVSTCLDRQLDRIVERVLAGQPVPTVDDEFYGAMVFRAPHRDYDDSVWRTLGTEGVTSHLDKGFAAGLSSYHSQLDSMQDAIVDFGVAERDLGIIARGVPLSPEARIDMVRRIEGLRRIVYAMGLDSNQLLKQLDNLGIRLAAAERKALLPNSRTTDFCRANGLPVTAPNSEIALS